MVGIYKITSPSNRVYIGQSVDIKGRWYSHTRGDDKGGRLQNSLQKYGPESHTFEVVEECLVELLNERERYWQDFYNVLGEYGLNCILTTTETRSGYCSKEIIEQRSKSLKVYHSNLSLEKKLQVGKKISEAYHNKSEEEKQLLKNKVSDFFTGKKLTKEHKAKISLNGRKGKHSQETINKMKANKNQVDLITGLTNSQLAGLKITATTKGRKVSEEMKQRISNTLKGRKIPQEQIDKRVETYRLRREQKLIDKNKENDN